MAEPLDRPSAPIRRPEPSSTETAPATTGRPRHHRWSAILLTLGWLLAIWALLLVNVTVVPGLVRTVLLQAATCAGGALLLLGAGWRLMPVRMRWSAAAVALLAGFALAEAARRLPYDRGR